jgi:hypothetical protein
MHYGDFLAFWSTFDVMVEIVIMRELGTTEEKTSIVCAGLGFGAKVHIACSLLNSRPNKETKRTVALLKEAQQLAERNSFAHGFFLINRATEKFELIRREVKDTYHARLREFDFDIMAKHTARFISKVNEFQSYAAISERDFLEYVKDIEAHALTLASLGKPLPESRTSSAKAKKK